MAYSKKRPAELSGRVTTSEEETYIYYTPSHPQVPSQVTTARYVVTQSPSQEAFDFKDFKNSRQGGKWVIFLNKQVRDSEGLTRLDHGWYIVADLVVKDLIPCATCTTALGSVTAMSEEKGVITCYTSDYTDKDDVENIARAVQRATNYEEIMYYKTNQASHNRIYRRFVHRNVSLYKLTPNGEFHQTDDQGRWM